MDGGKIKRASKKLKRKFSLVDVSFFDLSQIASFVTGFNLY